MYRPETFHLSKLFPAEFEVLLHYLKTRKSEIIVFGEVNIDTLDEHEDKTDYTTYWRRMIFKYQIFYQLGLHRYRKHVLIT